MTDYTLNIPPEIFHLIISYLDGDELFPCLGVSKRWRQIINIDELWKKICLKVRIFDPCQHTGGILPLCAWAEAYFLCRCVPMRNWRQGNFHLLNIQREESDYFRDAWDGHYVSIFYYTLGKINLYTIYGVIKLKQVIKVQLPRKESYDNASLSMNDPYIIAARFNVAVVFKKHTVYSIFKIISVTDTFIEGHYLKYRNVKLNSVIAWGCLWMRADTVKDTFLFDLKNETTKFITGKPHFAYNDDTKVVIAWTKNYVKVMNSKGDVKMTLLRNKIRALDFDSKYIILKIEDELEIINIKTGDVIATINIKAKEGILFELSHVLFLLWGKKSTCLTAVSPENGNNLWSVEGFKGRPSDLRLVGSKYIFIVPSYSNHSYSIFDRKGAFIREHPLPDGFDEYPSPLFGETLPFLVVTNESGFNIISFMEFDSFSVK